MKHQEILAKLTLEQKCALLSGADVFKTRELKEAGIPYIWLTDGPHGLRKQSGASDHLGLNPSEPATCYPTASAVACSWDEKLGEDIGEALAGEAKEQGVNVVLGPGLNMKRSPLCGRNFEYFSEDPYLAGKMAASYVRGIQKHNVAACPKHFAVNNQETRRMVSDSILDERTLREIYLTAFEIVVKEARPRTIMTSYNLINGVYANENPHLLQDILKKEWGYRGAVVTDWGCSNDHALGVKTGSTLEMPCPGWDSVRELLSAVKSGKVSAREVDERVSELLTLIDETKGGLPATCAVNCATDRHQLAARAAGESLTLLKNEDKILPIKEGCRVALIGDFGGTPRYQGAGSSQVNVRHPESVLDRMKESELFLVGYARGFDRLGRADETLLQEAEELAGKAEAVVCCLGLNEVQESEGLDRDSMELLPDQIRLLQRLQAVNANIIVVLMAGSVVETGWRSCCKGLLYAALSGEAGASAIVEVLTGRRNPGGHLAETWPERYTDTPARAHFAGQARTVEYREGIYIGYRYYQKRKRQVAFPFGYGLSYTTFAYENLQADEKQVRFTLKNTGDRKGTEIAQLYIGKKESELFRPLRELKGFARVELEAGESREVTISLDDKAFRYWNRKTNRWEIEGGTYRLEIGASCEDIRLADEISLQGTDAPCPYEKEKLPGYYSGQAEAISEAEFAELLGRPVPKSVRRINRHMTFGEMKYGKSPIGWLICAVLTALLKSSLKKGRPDLNLLFIYNMPLHALAKMTNGMVSMGMVDGIVMELKGFWVIGLIRLLYEFGKNLVLNRQMEKRIGAK